MSKRSKKPSFVMLLHETIDAPEFKSLTDKEAMIYILLRRHYNGSNNGSIGLSYGRIKNLRGYAQPTISEAFKGLEEKGWITKTKHGGLYRFSCHYELTGRYDRAVKQIGNKTGTSKRSSASEPWNNPKVPWTVQEVNSQSMGKTADDSAIEQ